MCLIISVIKNIQNKFLKKIFMVDTYQNLNIKLQNKIFDFR